MQMRKAVLAVITLVFVFLSLSACAFNIEYKKGFAMSKMVERCEIVVRGRVTNIEGVWRDNIDVNITTDVTITVSEIIKGTPNAGKDTVKFMIEGGTCTDPSTGEERILYASGVPTFELNEEVLLFLFNGESDSFYDNYPYGKMYPYRETYGVSKIVNDEVVMAYLLSETNDSDMKLVKFPVNLAVNLCKTAVIDKDAAIRLEKNIKTEMRAQDGKLIVLPDSLINRLKLQTKQIIDDAAQRERED